MHFRLCAGVFALVSIGLASDVRVVEEIVAKVNGDIITRGELERTRQELGGAAYARRGSAARNWRKRSNSRPPTACAIRSTRCSWCSMAKT